MELLIFYYNLAHILNKLQLTNKTNYYAGNRLGQITFRLF